MENIEKNQAINILVPKLIDRTEHLQKEIKSRLLLNKIFSEFENKASNKLNYFIANSYKRYNCSKFGNNLDLFLCNSQREHIPEVNKILNSDFYKDSDLKLEKKKMKYKSTTKLFSDINNIFNKIKYPLETRFSRNSKKQIKQIISNKDIKKKKIDNNIKNFEIRKITPEKRNIVRFYNQKALTNDKEIINSELNKEQKSIQNSIDEYLNKINSKILKQDINNNKQSPIILLNSESYSDKPKIKFPKIKFLNYNHSKPIRKIIIKKDIHKSPDMSKILPYYKLFKKRELEEKLNNDNNKIPFITEVGIKAHNKDYDYNNTQDIVYTSANNELKIKQNFDNKRKKLDDIFGLNDVPNITTYNNIMEQKIEKRKKEKLNKIKSMNCFKVSARKKLNDIINNEIEKLNQFEEKILSKSRVYNKDY